VDFERLPEREQTPLDSLPYDRWPSPGGGDFLVFYRTLDRYILRFPDLADFEIVHEDSRVTCVPAPDVPEASTAHLYLNQVLPLILSKQGKLVLHGSAVDVRGFAIGFVAASGKGKSTLATSFAIDGGSFLTDDGLVLESTDCGYLVTPSHPSVRLLRDSEDALMPLGAPKTPAAHRTPKSRFIAGPQLAYCADPRPLGAIYFLGDDVRDTDIKRLNPAQALARLLQHAFILDVDDRQGVGAHFERLATLAGRAACFQLDYPRYYDSLPSVLTAIRTHEARRGGLS
jgi:hypothetical protein